MSTATWYLRRKGVIGFTALLLAVSCDSGPEKPPPVTGCTIAGMEYADNAVNPNSPCQSCQLSISATEWTNLSDGLSCNQGNSVCTSGICKPGCFIGGMYYAAPDLDPANSCKICHPAETTLDWSNLPDGTTCAGGGVCTGGACQVGCYIQGTVYPDRSDNPADLTTCCSKAADPSGWTSRLIPGSTFDLGAPGADIVAADFNGDGADDLAAVDTGHDWVSLLLSDGAGGFLPIHTLTTESSPRAIVATDLNGDGKPDLIVKSSGQKTLDVFLNQGGGAFSGQVSYPAGNGIPGSMVVGDFDKDGNQDLICSQTEDGVVYFPGLGNGTLATGIPVLDAGGGTISAGDLNGDHVLDLLNADPNAGLVDLLGGIGDGGFISGGTAGPLSPPSLDAFMGDVNGDGLVDLAYTTSADIQVYYQLTTGLAGPFIFPVTTPPGGLGYGDLNGSGHPSLLVSSGGVGVLGNVIVDGGATQAVVTLLPVAGATSRMAVGDFNGDHGPDVALFTGNGISIFLNGCP